MSSEDKIAVLAEEFLKAYYKQKEDERVNKFLHINSRKTKKRRSNYKGERHMYTARFLPAEWRALKRLSKKIDLNINDTIVESLKLMFKKKRIRVI